MKRFLLYFILFYTSVIQVCAQRHQDKCVFSPERFRARLEQYITHNACLSPLEASKFFPIYAEMQEKQRTLHDELRNIKRIKPMTDAECKRSVERMDKIELEIKQIQSSFHERFMRILPASKVYDIIKAEDRFYRQAFRRASEDRTNKH